MGSWIKRNKRRYLKWRDSKNLKIIIFLIICYSVLIGCEKGASQSPSVPDIVKCCSVNSADTTPSTELQRRIKIYVDGSGSMKGYVNRNGTTIYGRVIEHLRNLSISGYSVSFYRFGQGTPTELQPDQFWQMRSRQGNSLYNQTYTQLGLTIANFLKEDPPASAYLVITDGVQALSGGSNYPAVVDPINRWLRENNHIFHIYAFRSEFSGYLYPPRAPMFRYQTGQESSTFRPFYIYAFVLDQGLEEEISRYMGRARVYHELLNFSEEIINRLKSVKFSVGDRSCLTKEKKRKDKIGRVIEFLSCSRREASFLSCSRRETSNEAKIKAILEIDPTPFGRRILQSLKDVRVKGNIWRWVKKEMIKKDSKDKNVRYYEWEFEPVGDSDRYMPDVGKVEIDINRLSTTFSTTLRFPIPQGSRWY
ncbi:MAG: hypothetical protein ACE5IH_09790, partial [Thermodesulfobacteriota bacterium]